MGNFRHIHKSLLFIIFILILISSKVYCADSLKVQPYNPINGPTLSAYPNPCQEFVYIDFINLTDYKQVVIQIIDICGQAVFTKTYEEDHPQDIKLKVILSDISRGIYFIKAGYGGNEITKKLVVK
ncbi:MAG: T9SS type A sorting domain-containing protein [Bacteroidales bacterium]|nr:T9SS type A sorting domain-containing protein [Bacteroidales bacterium]